MSPHFGSKESESGFTDARDDSMNACEDLLGGDAEQFLHIGVDVRVDRSIEGVASRYLQIREQTAAQLQTGQSVGSWIRCMVMVSSRCSFLWKKDVMETQSARWKKVEAADS